MDDCATLAKAIGWTGAITLPLHTIPFFFCARAIFLQSPRVIAFFAVLWLGTVGSSFTTPFFIHSRHLGDTKTCTIHLDEKFATGIVAVAAHNTLVFVSVTINLMMYTHEENWRGRLKAYFHRRGVSDLTKFLMESGQSYIVCVLLTHLHHYLVITNLPCRPIVVFNIVAATVNLITSVPSSYKLAFIVMNVAIQNAFTARIHRLIKLGIIDDHPTTFVTTALHTPATVDLPRPGESHLQWTQQDHLELTSTYLSGKPATLDLESQEIGVVEKNVV